VFIGMERCHPTRWLIQSSTGAPQGGFYEYCQDPRFKHYKVTAFECPHLGEKRAAELAVKHGRDSLAYRSIIEAEWMADPNETFVCSRRAIEKCLSTHVIRQPGRAIGAIDVAHAEGGNENVFAVRYGNQIEIDAAFKGSGNASVVVDRLINRFNLRKLKPHDIWIDADGMGSIYANLFADKGWTLNLWRGQERAYDSNTFKNRSAESWFGLARAVEQSAIILPPDDIFINQFTSRRYFINDKGQIQLDPKENDSPDRADAITIVWSIVTSQACQVLNMMGYDPFSEQDFDPLDNARPSRDWSRVLPSGCNVGI
jgi:hypothetical protein